MSKTQFASNCKLHSLASMLAFNAIWFAGKPLNKQTSKHWTLLCFLFSLRCSDVHLVAQSNNQHSALSSQCLLRCQMCAPSESIAASASSNSCTNLGPTKINWIGMSLVWFNAPILRVHALPAQNPFKSDTMFCTCFVCWPLLFRRCFDCQSAGRSRGARATLNLSLNALIDDTYFHSNQCPPANRSNLQPPISRP